MNINMKVLGFSLAIIGFLIVILIPTPGLSFSGHAALALLLFAIIMWLTEALHLAVTSLLILFIQPIFGVASFNDAVIGFANPIIFLMIGGFIIAESIPMEPVTSKLKKYSKLDFQ